MVLMSKVLVQLTSALASRSCAGSTWPATQFWAAESAIAETWAEPEASSSPNPSPFSSASPSAIPRASASPNAGPWASASPSAGPRTSASPSAGPWNLGDFLCGCGCRDYTVNSCQTEEREECQRYFRDKCEVKYHEECDYDTREECETEYVNDCTTKEEESCRTEYKEICQRTLTESPHHSNRRFYDFGHKEKAKKEECVDVPEEVCQILDVPQCSLIPKENCHSVEVPNCHSVPEKICHKVPDRRCKLNGYLVSIRVKHKECSHCHHYDDIHYHVEYKRKCEKHPVPKCHVEQAQHCEYEERRHCTTVYNEVCEEGQGTDYAGRTGLYRSKRAPLCKHVPDTQCDTVQVPNCHYEDEEVCVTEYETKCSEIPVKIPRKVKKKKCVWPELKYKDDQRC